mmetsp:Transcript_13530/g.53639  ORF Transcript_13530/g.53639 Transcript_13530/m.53639 type:complete len:200 (-) Transcript_13530:3803-4402(-)
MLEELSVLEGLAAGGAHEAVPVPVLAQQRQAALASRLAAGATCRRGGRGRGCRLWLQQVLLLLLLEQQLLDLLLHLLLYLLLCLRLLLASRRRGGGARGRHGGHRELSRGRPPLGRIRIPRRRRRGVGGDGRQGAVARGPLPRLVCRRPRGGRGHGRGGRGGGGCWRDGDLWRRRDSGGGAGAALLLLHRWERGGRVRL